MKRNSLMLLADEFIGRSVIVKNKKIQGIIIDETKKTFEIKNEKNKIQKVVKKGSEFEIKIDTQKLTVHGQIIEKRPWERLDLKI